MTGQELRERLDLLVDTNPLQLRDEAVALLGRAERLTRQLDDATAALADARMEAQGAEIAWEAERDRYREALTSIGTRCEAFTGRNTCLDDPGRSPNGNYLTDRWCNGCIARTALGPDGSTHPDGQEADQT